MSWFGRPAVVAGILTWLSWLIDMAVKLAQKEYVIFVDFNVFGVISRGTHPPTALTVGERNVALFSLPPVAPSPPGVVRMGQGAYSAAGCARCSRRASRNSSLRCACQPKTKNTQGTHAT